MSTQAAPSSCSSSTRLASAAGVGGDDDAAELEVAAAHAVQDVAERGRADGHEVHVDREVAADLAARVGEAAAAVEGEVDRERVQRLAVVAVVGDVAGGEHRADVALGDRAVLDLDLAGDAVGARPAAGEADDDVVDAQVRHLLRALDRGPDRALALLHGESTSPKAMPRERVLAAPITRKAPWDSAGRPSPSPRSSGTNCSTRQATLEVPMSSTAMIPRLSAASRRARIARCTS